MTFGRAGSTSRFTAKKRPRGISGAGFCSRSVDVTVVTRHLSLAVALAIGFLGIAGVSGQQPAGTGPYTTAQAAAGRAVYQAECSSCHSSDLRGNNEAPPLAGTDFMNTWRNRTTAELLSHTQTMPPGRNNLDLDRYLSLVAFILQSNGAAGGSQPFTPSINV